VERRVQEGQSKLKTKQKTNQKTKQKAKQKTKERRRGNSSKKGEEKWMCWRPLHLSQVQIPATFLCYFL
jgi:hypothetical protein